MPLKFIDLFAGIGGFHQAMYSVGGKCVFASEWDGNARISYEANYKDIEPKLFKKGKDGKYLYFNEDINDAIPSEIPDFDVCCGGFPLSYSFARKSQMGSSRMILGADLPASTKIFFPSR